MTLRSAVAGLALAILVSNPAQAQGYVPTGENLEARAEFAGDKFGIFLHWGIYSMFAQGEWYLNRDGIQHQEYAKAASAFYPAYFNAAEWVSAIKASGAKYICFTTRHHDGFSMFDTAQSPYNIVDATPFGRDVLKELADECHKQGIRLHLYYSHIDWGRDDYPAGRTGLTTGKDPAKADWKAYYEFMNAQLRELLTNYGKIGCIWFDGFWDHDSARLLSIGSLRSSTGSSTASSRTASWPTTTTSLLTRVRISRSSRGISRARTRPDSQARISAPCHWKPARP